MKTQRLPIIVGLVGDALFILLFFLPLLANLFFGPFDDHEQGGIFVATFFWEISLCFVMAGFGITRFLWLPKTSKFRYVILGIYLAPFLFEASFWIFICGLSYWQVHYQLGLK